MPSDTILKLRDAISEIEQGRVARKKTATLSHSRSRTTKHSSKQHDPFVSTNELPTREDENEKDVSPDAAFKRIIKLVSVRDRCRSELADRLRTEDFPQESIDDALERAQRVLIVDDMRFAEQYIRGHISAGKGSAGIERELARFNISAFEVPGWPYEFFDEDDEFDRALNLLRNHPPRSKNPRESAYRKLVQKGYGSDIAASASRAWWENSAK